MAFGPSAFVVRSNYEYNILEAKLTLNLLDDPIDCRDYHLLSAGWESFSFVPLGELTDCMKEIFVAVVAGLARGDKLNDVDSNSLKRSCSWVLRWAARDLFVHLRLDAVFALLPRGS